MRLAIDTGGTFTDCIYLEGRERRVLKVFSTPQDHAHAILGAIEQLTGSREVSGQPAASSSKQGLRIPGNR